MPPEVKGQGSDAEVEEIVEQRPATVAGSRILVRQDREWVLGPGAVSG